MSLILTRSLSPLLLLCCAFTGCGASPASKPPQTTPTPEAQPALTNRAAPPAPEQGQRTEPLTPAEPEPAPPKALPTGKPESPIETSRPSYLRMDPAQPAAIEEEQEHLASAYTELDKMSSDSFLAGAYIMQAVRPVFEIHQQDLEYTELGYYSINADKGLNLLWVNHAGLNHVLLVIDNSGKVLDRHHIEGRARVKLRDVVLDGDKEIFVERILGTLISTYPSEWSIFRVNRWGKLRHLLSHDKGHSAGAKNLEWAYMNHFEFEGPTELTINTVHSSCEDSEYIPLCPAPGQTVHYSYSPSQDKYRRVWWAPQSHSSAPSGKTSGKPRPRRAPSSRKPAPSLKLEF